MKIKSFALLLLLLCNALASAQNHWESSGTFAYTKLESGVDIQVIFPRDTGCDIALFSVVGNADIDSISLCSERKCFDKVIVTEYKSFSDEDPHITFALSEPALRELKNARAAMLVTDEGSVAFLLDGSAEALTKAWRFCMAASEQKKSTLLRGGLR